MERPLIKILYPVGTSLLILREIDLFQQRILTNYDLVVRTYSEEDEIYNHLGNTNETAIVFGTEAVLNTLPLTDVVRRYSLLGQTEGEEFPMFSHPNNELQDLTNSLLIKVGRVCDEQAACWPPGVVVVGPKPQPDLPIE
jgi:hypothetical protein